MRRLTCFFALVCLVGMADDAPGDIEGRWLSGDGDGFVEIRLAGDGLSGVVLGSPNDDPDRADTDLKNPDPSLRGRALKGLSIFAGFRYAGDGTWSDGTIYDPNSGNTYRATLRLVDRNTLTLRGYIGIPLFGRTELWHRQAD